MYDHFTLCDSCKLPLPTGEYCPRCYMKKNKIALKQLSWQDAKHGSKVPYGNNIVVLVETVDGKLHIIGNGRPGYAETFCESSAAFQTLGCSCCSSDINLYNIKRYSTLVLE